MTVVFVHGVPETADVWDGVRAHLGIDSVALALPGFGRGRPDSFIATKDGYAAWLEAELRRIPGPIDLVGHDVGALLVYRIAANSDVVLRSWVADGASALHPDYGWHELAKSWQTVGAGEEFVRQAVVADLDAPEGVATALRSLGAPDAQARRMHQQFDARMDGAVLDFYRSAINPYRDWGNQLKRTCAPGLVINPVHDRFDDYLLAAEVARQLGATFYIMPDAGHWWMLEHPAAAATALHDFWESLFPGQRNL
ncbi:alpha/beta fold hydrolase [Nocardia suismassiliense]|uniref:Alpha/beta fold hydrolase n=1 Tax=Nocardia suismassiliense TaxID=2077092 RepID=A0ABW6QXX7_9NOCA